MFARLIALPFLLLAVPALAQAPAVATANVNVRSGPATHNPVVDVLVGGELVTVVECTVDERWCFVDHTGPDGWVRTTYLADPPAGSVADIPYETPPASNAEIYIPPQFGAPVYDEPALDGDGVYYEEEFGPEPGRGYEPGREPSPGRVPSNEPFPEPGFRIGNVPDYNENFPRVCFYTAPDYAGDEWCVDAGTARNRLDPHWNDQISSILLFGGAQVDICSDPGFLGPCQSIAASRPQLNRVMDDEISSFRTH